MLTERTRRSPERGVVEEGALFDLEVGPENLVFPFRLSFSTYLPERGTAIIDSALIKLLNIWGNGQLFLGGQKGTGKGRFSLEITNVYNYLLNDKVDLLKALLYRNFFSMTVEELADTEIELAPANDHDFSCLKPRGKYYLPWVPLEYEITFISPLLSEDTIASLTDPEGRDAIMTRKVILGSNGKPVSCVCLKGEGIRGLWRFITGKNGKKKIEKEKREIDGKDEYVNLHETIHDECSCSLCKIFGNVHHQGMLIFEDAVPLSKDDSDQIDMNPREKTFDHVAIDRVSGKGPDGFKFDDTPLEASPKNSLKFKGKIWAKREIIYGENFVEERRLLGKAISDIRNGLFPFGGNVAIGYGQVGGIEFINLPNDYLPPELKLSEVFSHNQEQPVQDPGQTNQDHEQAEKEIENKLESQHLSLPNPKIPDINKDINPDINKEAVYYPYYFLKLPNQKPYRIPNEEVPHPVSHAIYDPDRYRYTGKLICRLTTKGTIFIPDTSEPLKEEDKGKHKKYKFSRLGESIIINGSEIRGLISSVFEAITNSCLRVFDQKEYLSWRMSPKTPKKNKGEPRQAGIYPGRVKIIKVKKDKEDKEVWKIEEMEEIRLPFYDHKEVTEKIGEMTIADKNIMDAVQKIKDKHKGIKKSSLNGLEEIWVCKKKANNDNPKDFIVTDVSLTKINGYKKGYIKFSGANVVEKIDEKDINDIKLKGDIDKLKLMEEISENLQPETIYHNEVITATVNNKEREIPVFIGKSTENGKTYYYIMKKRCERVFISSDKSKEYDLPPNIRKKYYRLMKSYGYEENAQAPLAPFRTRQILDRSKFNLQDGDLIYFQAQGNEVIDVIPVRISRKASDLPLGKKLAENNQDHKPCTQVECLDREDCELCHTPSCQQNKDLQEPHPMGLCPACHLFGTGFYKSRVRFGLDYLENEPIFYNKSNRSEEGSSGSNEKASGITLPLLESPRLTWSMPRSSDTILGRKFYLHHPASVDELVEKTAPGETPNNCTILEPLAEGNNFGHEIYFDNFSKEELGLLIHSIELEEGLGHKLGLGKALGFGSVSILVNKILCRQTSDDPTKDGILTDCTHDKNSFIEAGRSQLEKWFGSPWHEVEHIKSLRQILWIPPKNNVQPKVFYPALNSKEDAENKPGYEKIKEKWDEDTRRSILLSGHDDKHTHDDNHTQYDCNPWWKKPWRIGDSIPEYAVVASDKPDQTQKKEKGKYYAEPSRFTEQKTQDKATAGSKVIRETGIVKKWIVTDRGGYGFIIKDSDKSEIYVNPKHLKNKRYLKKDDRVEFEIGESPKGGQQAINVTVF